MTLFKWLRQAEIDEDGKPGMSRGESAELREVRRRIKLLEQETRCCAARRRTCRKRVFREKALPA